MSDGHICAPCSRGDHGKCRDERAGGPHLKFGNCSCCFQGDAVVLVREPFEPDPQAARETVELMKRMSSEEQMSRAKMRASLLAFSIRASTADLARICELALRLSPPGPEEQRIEGVHLDGVSADTVRKVLAGLLEEMAAEQPKPASSGFVPAPDGGPHDMIVGPCACGATHEAPKPADHFASPTERTT